MEDFTFSCKNIEILLYNKSCVDKHVLKEVNTNNTNNNNTNNFLLRRRLSVSLFKTTLVD